MLDAAQQGRRCATTFALSSPSTKLYVKGSITKIILVPARHTLINLFISVGSTSLLCFGAFVFRSGFCIGALVFAFVGFLASCSLPAGKDMKAKATMRGAMRRTMFVAAVSRFCLSDFTFLTVIFSLCGESFYS